MEKEQKKYEISFLVRDENGQQEITKTLESCQASIIDGGNVLRINLAYQIKKENEAYFGYLHFLANTDKIKNISDDLKLNQKVLRFLIITPPITKMMRMETQRIIKKTFQPRAVERMEIKKPSPAPTATLSNEALEKKLEEILK